MKKIIGLIILLTLASCSMPTATPLIDTPGTADPAQTVIQPLQPSLPGPAFPRLGMWWPDPWEQPLEDIARYDWVILGDWASEFLDPLLALNPEILLLNSTNACEVDYDPDDPDYNNYLQAIPAEWYLTQVGTTLRADVDSAQTVLPVEALTISDGTTTYDLFVPGDTVLIEGESVYVKAVNRSDRTLTVRRGYVRPAAAHSVGTRIAAHISFWPDSWLLNVSTLSPEGIADPAVGPETWSSYHARLDAQLLDDPRWAGILVDRSDPNESWLIGNSTARTIDPDQSNTLLTDYSAFDAAWNEGLRLYLQELRSFIGPGKIIYLNWGIPYYDLVNGNNLEGFPTDSGDSYNSSWHTTMFGPWIGRGSYFEWLANAPQPNLTMIETYEDDSGPDPSDTDGYPNRCNSLFFTPDYRKMRFGLATALLNDGYFSYEMNTEGHGSLCLMWFDEYDNAGAGRGYLGYPLGPAVQIFSGTFIPEVLINTGFDSETDLATWDLWADTGYAASATIDASDPAAGSGSLRVDVSETLGSDWQVSLITENIGVSEGVNYTLTFRARADRPRSISAWIQQSHAPWEGWVYYDAILLTTDWQEFTLTAASTGDDNQAQFIFGLGEVAGSVWLDDVHLKAGAPDVYRRDFEHGIVLINASADPVTIPLGGTFQKIDGTQDRSVNDGSTVTEVTLPPLDGIILLRP